MLSRHLELTRSLNELGLAKSCCFTNQSRGGRTEHHPTRRRHRLHPLSHPHLLTNSGVTQSDRADLTSDYLTGIEPYTQGQVDAVAIADLGSQQCTFFLDT